MSANLKTAPFRAARLSIETDEVAPLRAHYEGMAHDVLQSVWRHKLLLLSFMMLGVAAGSAALLLMPPYYASEAIIQVSFSREDSSTNTNRTQRIAAVEATAVVESAARIIRSRALATAVAARLGLDGDPEFTRASRTQRAIWAARDAFGLPITVPSARDLAAEKLMHAVRVVIEPRTYVISVGINAGKPDRAAQLANAVALEYIRGQALQQLAEAQRTAERAMFEVSALYGPRHPKSVAAQTRSLDLQARIAAIRDAPPTEKPSDLIDGEFFPGEPVMIPAGPNIYLTFGGFIGAALALWGGLVWLLERRRGGRHRPEHA